MDTVRYCTPEWLEESARQYERNPKFKQDLANLSVDVCFRIKRDNNFGIEQDILFCAFVDKGDLTRIGFISEKDAKDEAEFILSATPKDWKKLLHGETKFVANVLLGKVIVEQGSKSNILKLAPHAGTFLDVLTQVELLFPDDMPPQELEQYRAYLIKFRSELSV